MNNTAQDTLSPKLIATEAFTDATTAVGRLHDIYGRNTGFLRHHLEAYVRGGPLNSRVRATYPFVRITTTTILGLIPASPTALSPAPARTRLR